jgi:tRNA-2-methylthio-N6-dimethylallyladenosine synthase
MKRFLIHTFGCQMNAHDSRRMTEVLCAQGYQATDSPEAADVIVLNTCSVRDKAEHKLLSALGKLRPLKENHDGLLIAVAGCMAQEHGEGLLRRSDLIDVLIGPDNVADLPQLLQQAELGGATASRIEFDLAAPSFLTARARPDGSEVCAYVTVMKGCDERCSFCIVPYTRGPERYRAADEIVAEVKTLCEGGVREITLLGQTVNSWHEPSAPARDAQSRFAALLRRIAQEVPELARLRYTSPHPRHVTPELVAAHGELGMLPAHVHLPMQSGSDRVLKRMIRRYSRDGYLERARALQSARAGLTLSTDIIVGFPGETEQDFEDTLSLVEEVGFVAAFGFKYSPRPGTPALKLDDELDEQVKTERLSRLFELTDRLQQRHLSALLGTSTRVLFEGPSDRRVENSDALHVVPPTAERTVAARRFTGRSDRHEIVHVDAPDGVDLTGALLEVQVTQANKRSLVGELVGPAPAARTPARGRASLHLPVVGA